MLLLMIWLVDPPWFCIFVSMNKGVRCEVLLSDD